MFLNDFDYDVESYVIRNNDKHGMALYLTAGADVEDVTQCDEFGKVESIVMYGRPEFVVTPCSTEAFFAADELVEIAQVLYAAAGRGEVFFYEADDENDEGVCRNVFVPENRYGEETLVGKIFYNEDLMRFRFGQSNGSPLLDAEEMLTIAQMLFRLNNHIRNRLMEETYISKRQL